MTTVRALVRRSVYVDSISLMQGAEVVRGLPGVESAALLLATEANRVALREAGLWTPEVEDARPTDLVIAVRAATVETAERALARAEAQLSVRHRTVATAAPERPRSVARAARELDDTNLAVISVPGKYATNEAAQALAAGLHVFLFSDDVPLEDEIELKRRARDRALLFMGPECGTSLIGGVGLGFANRVRHGPVGLVGASGTGLQEVSTLLHRFGSGVSHAIGTGGRDLHDDVGGLTTLSALDRLASDPTTRAIVLVSKPASDRVAAAVLSAAAGLGKPVIACLLGWRGRSPAKVRIEETLEDTAAAAVHATGGQAAKLAEPRSLPPTHGGVAALYTGGTLCEEARQVIGAAAVRVVDFGASDFTRGRPHPMIDPELRNAAIVAAAGDLEVGILLLDFVLGQCAHPDPVGAAAPAIRAARAAAGRAGRTLAVIAHVVGTDEDAQGLTAQEEALCALDVAVYPSNRLAAVAAREMAEGAPAR